MCLTKKFKRFAKLKMSHFLLSKTYPNTCTVCQNARSIDLIYRDLSYLSLDKCLAGFKEKIFSVKTLSLFLIFSLINIYEKINGIILMIKNLTFFCIKELNFQDTYVLIRE